jgi:cell division septation protein DedD
VNRSYDSDDDLQDPGPHDREISLGTTTILGIFFVLALLCAVFFGFGYSMGRRSAQSIVGASEAGATSDATSAKPAPGSLGSRVVPASHASNQAADANGTAATSDDFTPTEGNASPATPASRPQISRAAPSAQPTENSAIKPVSMPRPATATSGPPVPVAIPGMGSAVVQVAAVSHQEDADVLMTALKKHGYTVAIRQEPQDKLLHVQIGPFANTIVK